MAQIKVKKRDVVVINSILFLFLAFFFLYLQYAYRHHLSPFSLVYLRKSIELFWFAALPIVGTIVLLWRHHTWGPWAFLFSTSIVSFRVVEGLFIEFNKIIVIALFFYVVVTYFLYQLLLQYLNLASINANYAKTDLFAPMLRNINCFIDYEGQTVEGNLSNWDDKGCFVYFANAHKLSNKVTIKVIFQGREFVQEGEVVAQSVEMNGVGIRFSKINKNLKIFNWAEFIEIVDELGFESQRLR